MSLHSMMTLADNHPPFRWEWADAAARLATTVTSDDISKVGWQHSDGTAWVLSDTTPTWTGWGSVGVMALDDLSDVDATGPGAGDVLSYDGVDWTNVTLALTYLSDVDPTGSVLGDVLVYDGAQYVPQALSSADTHAVSDAATVTPSTAVTLQHNTSGAAAAGFGTRIDFEADDDTNPDATLGSIAMVWRDPSTGVTRTDVVIKAASDYGAVTDRMVLAGIDSNAAGDARGDGAVDLQGSRAFAANVASGDYSNILGGISNSATNNFSGVVGGFSSSSLADYATVLQGYYNLAHGAHSVVLNGVFSETHNTGQIAAGTDANFADPNDAQGTMHIIQLASVTHADANWYTVNVGAGTIGIIVPVDFAYTFRTQLVGVTQGMAKVFGYEINGVITNDAGTTTLLASNVTTLYETDADFEARVSALDSLGVGYLVLEVRDSTSGGDTVRWVGRTTWVQVGYPG